MKTAPTDMSSAIRSDRMVQENYKTITQQDSQQQAQNRRRKISASIYFIMIISNLSRGRRLHENRKNAAIFRAPEQLPGQQQKA